MSTDGKTKKLPIKPNKNKAKYTISLPRSTTIIEIGGIPYSLTPAADMREWLEDMNDILESKKALDKPGKSIPFDVVMKKLGIRLPPRKAKTE